MAVGLSLERIRPRWIGLQPTSAGKCRLQTYPPWSDPFQRKPHRHGHPNRRMCQ